MAPIPFGCDGTYSPMRVRILCCSRSQSLI